MNKNTKFARSQLAKAKKTITIPRPNGSNWVLNYGYQKRKSRYSYRGRAYSYVPSISPFYGKAKRLVVVAVGDNSKFPKTNEVTKIKWVKIQPGESYDASMVRSVGNDNENWLEKRIETKQSYGGKNAPIYTMNNWKEALIAITAHELAHIHQYVFNLGTGEYFTETKANEILELYRKSLTSQL